MNLSKADEKVHCEGLVFLIVLGRRECQREVWFPVVGY
jgi:hypothetical protein